MTQSLPPRKLVLYADDDPDDIELITEAFSEFSEGVRLVTFGDGEELLRFLEMRSPFEPKPCLVILDINMPGKNGKETLKRIRGIREFDEVPVVLFSTSTLPADAAFAGKLDAGFITKPIHTRQIQQIIDQLIEHCPEETKNHIKKFKRK